MYIHHGPGVATSGGQAPHIELSVSDDIYRQGDGVRVTFRSDVDAYVTIFRVDTDGRVRLLFPQDPWDDNFARGDRRYDVDNRKSGRAFVVDDYPGQGYVFAVASADPFDYAAYVRGDHWDYRAIGNGGRVVGDPYQALSDLIDHIVPANYIAYSYDVAPYYVEERYEYPRFLCYDCHSYSAYPYWNPYRTSCIRFRVVIYDDPFYYPARGFVGTRVVYARPARPVPRYVFKDRVAAEPYIARVRQRPVDEGGRRVVDRGATSRDLGGRPVPIPMRSPSPVGEPRTAPRRLDGSTGGPDRPVPQPGVDTRRPTAVPTPERLPTRAEPRVTTPPTVQPATPRLERREPTRTAEPSRPTEPRRSGGEVQRSAEPRRTEPSREPARAEPPRSAPPRSEPKSAPPPSKPTQAPPPRRTGH
jgi:hypothetical protein